MTPLIAASCEGVRDLVELFSWKGKNLEHRDESGWTALQWACYIGNRDIVEILLNRGANIESQVELNENPQVRTVSLSGNKGLEEK